MPNVRAGKYDQVVRIAGGKCIVRGTIRPVAAVSFALAAYGVLRVVCLITPGKYVVWSITVASKAYRRSSDIEFQGAEHVRI